MNMVCVQNRDFTIIFRSFGKDFPGIIEEMNMFCTGKHPQYPGVGFSTSHTLSSLLLTVSIQLKSSSAKFEDSRIKIKRAL